MDPVSAAELRDILWSNNARMKHQEEQIMATVSCGSGLGSAGFGLDQPVPTVKDRLCPCAHCAQPTTCYSTRRPLHSPAAYSGEPQLCHIFLSKCSLLFAFILSYWGVQSGFCDYTVIWTSSALGNSGVGTRTSLLLIISVLQRQTQNGVWWGSLRQGGKIPKIRSTCWNYPLH